MTPPDFSQARQRLTARRQQRQANAQAHRLGLSTFTSPGHLPQSLRTLEGAGADLWSSIKGREGTRPAFRVGQVDAELLDEELLQLLKGQAGDALKYFGSHLSDDWSAEILLALRAALFKISIWDHDATYGATLQNLKFTDARKKSAINAAPTAWQKAAYGLFSVGGKYAWGKWENWLMSRDGGYEEVLLSSAHGIVDLLLT